MDYAEKMQRCNEYVEALEGERRKIQVFQRELPLCLELVTQAIEACRKELSGTTTDYMHGQSECSEQTSSDGPVLEEFIPIKRARSSSDVNGNDDDDDDDDNRDHEQRSRKRNRSSLGSHINNEKACSNSHNNNSDHKKKSDWLRSVQLWNQSPDPPPARPELPREAAVTEVKRDGVGGAFHPFRREKSNVKTSTNNQMAKKPASSPPASATSSMTEMVTAEANNGGGGNSKGEETDGQTQRKQRRCWSPELHRRFLQALQQLGGSHAATPKQIRELMKVDGLTNDEVKSHLQKYRLHTRRPSPSHGIHNTASTQAPQFVVVGGIWVPPPPEYAAVATRTTTSREAATIAASHGIYTPLAAPPPLKTQHASKSNSPAQKSPQTESDHLPSDGRSSHSEEGHHSNSSSTSSTTHTTTNSPEY